MSEGIDLEKRLAELDGSRSGPSREKKRPSIFLALAGTAGIVVLAGMAFVLMQEEPQETLSTARPDEFQPVGEGFGEVQPFPDLPAPEPDVVFIEPDTQPNAELLEQLAALQAQIEELQNAPEPVVQEDTAAAEAITALTARISALQEASENAQEQFASELAARDRALRQLRTDLDLAKLQQPPPSITPSNADLLEADRLRELERRRAEEAAFQQARIESPTIAFGGSGGAGSDGALADRTFGEVTDFVLNGARPAQVTQAEVIANPSNTVVQGTMIQAVMETALSSELPGQVRSVISEDVHSFDGSRVLIPRGSKLVGRYRAGADIAQSRVTIAWDRIIMPNNQTVEISSFGGDELGRAGVTGFVDTRFDDRFGAAALVSLITAVPGAVAAQTDSGTSANVLQDVGDDLADSTDSVIGEYLSIGPVIYVEQGARITVMVDRDLEIF